MTINIVVSRFLVDYFNTLSAYVAPYLTAVVAGHVSTCIIFHPLDSTLRTASFYSILNDIFKTILHGLKFQTFEVPLHISLYFFDKLFIVIVLILKFLNLVEAYGTTTFATSLAVEEI